MDSISSHHLPPLKSLKSDRDHPRWSNRHDDPKRVSSPLDRNRYHWRKGYPPGERELNSDGEESMDPRLERARSFGKKDEIGRSGGAFFGKPFPSDTDRSDSPRIFGSKRSVERDRESFDRVETPRFSAQKSFGSVVRHEERQDSEGKASFGVEEFYSGRSSHGKGSGTESFRYSKSSGTDSFRNGKGSDTERDVKHSIKVSPSMLYSDGAGEPGKGSPRKEHVTEKDSKRSSKLSPKNSSDMETVEADKEAVSKGRKEGKPPVLSPKRPGASSDEGSWKSNSFTKAQEEQKSPGSYEQRPAKKGLETPVTFLHVARRARSERRREDPAKSQSSKSVSLDGFGAELEEALLKKLEAEVDYGAEQTVGLKNKTVDKGALALLSSSDIAVVQSDGSLLHKVEDVQTQKRHSSGETSEREEGELEPDDDFVEVKHLEVDNGRGESADAEMQVESKLDDYENKANLGGDREGGDCQQMHTEVRELQSRVSEDEARCFLDGQKLSDDCEPDTKHKQGAIRDKEDLVHHGQDFSTRCEPDMKGTLRDNEDHGDLFLQHKVTMPPSSTKMEVGESLCAGSASSLLPSKTSAAELHAKQSNLASIEKGYDSEELALSLFMQPAVAEAETSKEEGLGIHRHRDLTGKLESKQTRGVHHVQAENVVKDLASHDEDLDELSVYNHKQKKLKVESLQLSLALPGTSMASAGSCPPSLAGPVENERSFQSLTHTPTHAQSLSQLQAETISEGFTTSLSLSSFVHNPSCSLNCTFLENQELSCGGSKQLSQELEHTSHRSWKNCSGNDGVSNGFNNSVTSLSIDRREHKCGVPLYHRVLQNGNLQSHAEFPSGTGSNRSSGSNPISQRSHQQIRQNTEAPRYGLVSSQDRQSMMGKDFPDGPQQLGRQAQSQPHVQLESFQDGPSSAKIFITERSKEMVGVRSMSSEKIGLHEISSEPIAVMAHKLQELPDSFLEGLKDLVKELLGSFSKRNEFLALQQIIKRRTDLNEEMLLRAHPTQLEILVALKMGMQVFVKQSTKTLTYKALIEIFLQTRCRNVDCQLSLPVDGCECKVCSQKSGFCHECMCMVCSKFDSDNNTSRWVGCDICMHWCHTDCGLRMSHIKPTPISQGGAGSSEIQFQCLSCGHYMELFGFVKGVFDNFAGAWGAETLAKELDCVRRIFHGSEDVRGKQLCWKAEKMLQKLENNVAATDVCRNMLQFFHEGSSELDGAGTGPPKQVNSLKSNEVSDHVADATKGLPKMDAIVGRKLADLEKIGVAGQVFNREPEGQRAEVADLRYERARKKAEIEDLHSIIQVKQAEVMMFQARADAARQEANSLQNILSVKAEKIEEDFACKYAKLRLDEVEERRRKWLEESQTLERSQRDYQKMKIRLESDIKSLMMKTGLSCTEETCKQKL